MMYLFLTASIACLVMASMMMPFTGYTRSPGPRDYAPSVAGIVMAIVYAFAASLTGVLDVVSPDAPPVDVDKDSGLYWHDDNTLVCTCNGEEIARHYYAPCAPRIYPSTEGYLTLPYLGDYRE